jgi:hypothetical protein
VTKRVGKNGHFEYSTVANKRRISFLR